jgi:hypothetical protein
VEIAPPMPGKIPIPSPISEERKKFTRFSLNSFKENPNPYIV